MEAYGFLSVAKNVGKNIDKNTSKNWSGKYGQKLLDHAKQYTTDALKMTLKKWFQNSRSNWWFDW